MLKIRKEDIEQVIPDKPVFDKIELIETINCGLLTKTLKFAAHKTCKFDSNVIINLAVCEDKDGELCITKLDFDLKKEYMLLHGNNIPEKIFEIIEKLMNLPFNDSMITYLREIKKMTIIRIL